MKIKEWYCNLEFLEKGILFINIIWILMFMITFYIFNFLVDEFEIALQHNIRGLELLQVLISDFAFIWAMGFALIGFVDFCIALFWVQNKISKKPVVR